MLACEAATEVELLEPGTPAAAVLIASWRGRKAFDEAWDSAVSTSVVGLIAGFQDAVALAAEGLPLEGLPEQPEVPTVASVPVVVLDTPPTYMAIQGSVSDDERIVSYRDTILPMMKERDRSTSSSALAVAFVFCKAAGTSRSTRSRAGRLTPPPTTSGIQSAIRPSQSRSARALAPSMFTCYAAAQSPGRLRDRLAIAASLSSSIVRALVTQPRLPAPQQGGRRRTDGTVA